MLSLLDFARLPVRNFVALGVLAWLGNSQTPPTASPNAPPGKWVDIWSSMPQLTEQSNLPPAPFVSWRLVRLLYAITCDSASRMIRQVPAITNTPPLAADRRPNLTRSFSTRRSGRRFA